MLENIREKKWIAYTILVPVIIAMAFFGIDSYFSTKIETYAARIEGPPKFMIWGAQEKEISQDQFRRRFEQARAQERARLGEEFDSATFESLESKRQVLDSMVDEELLGLVAQRDGLSVGEAQVAEQLKTMPEFQVNGAYSVDRYRLVLAEQGLSHAQFMANMRGDLARRTVPSQIVGSALSSDAELDAFLKLNRQTRDLQLVDLPTPALPAEAPTAAQLQAWYKDHASDYRSEEKVALEYVEIDAAALDVPMTVDEASLRARYEELGARYVTQPQRSAAHILVAVPADADEAAVEAARLRAVDLANQARAPGADFAAIARASTDDLGSKADGGALGVVEPGQLGDEFDAALLSLAEPGQVSQPVRTPAGWHVIQLTELTPGSERPFEEVRGEIEAEVLATERERAFSDLSGRLIDLVYKDPTALAPAAEAVGLPVQRTQLFGRSQATGLAALPAVREVAFSEAQMIERQVSDTIEIGPNHVVVIHVIEHQPEAALAYEAVKDRVLSDFNADRLAKAAKAQAEALLARANKGETLEALATALGRTVASLPGVTRQAQLPPAVLGEAFRLAAPAKDKPSVGIARISPDRYALVAVTAVAPGDLTGLDEPTRVQLREQLAQARGLVEYEAYMKSLRNHYTVTVAEDRL